MDYASRVPTSSVWPVSRLFLTLNRPRFNRTDPIIYLRRNNYDYLLLLMPLPKLSQLSRFSLGLYTSILVRDGVDIVRLVSVQVLKLAHYQFRAFAHAAYPFWLVCLR